MKHICILGKLPTKFLCPYFEDENVEIYSMNSHFDEMLIPRVDKWFDLHEHPEKENADYTKENFPFADCHELVHGRRFCSTMAYIIAYAILQGAKKLSFYGSKFNDDGNPHRQRELHNVRELIFFAMGKGIEIEICEDDVEYLLPEHIPNFGEDFDSEEILVMVW